MCRSQGLSRTLPLDEVSPFTSLEAPTWEQDHPAPQRGLQEGPAQILLWMVIASGSLTKHHKVYARESVFREWKTRLLWQILSGNDWGLQRASPNYSPAATILTTLWWGIGYSHLVLCPARQLRSPSVLPSYCLSTPEHASWPSHKAWPLGLFVTHTDSNFSISSNLMLFTSSKM